MNRARAHFSIKMQWNQYRKHGGEIDKKKRRQHNRRQEQYTEHRISTTTIGESSTPLVKIEALKHQHQRKLQRGQAAVIQHKPRHDGGATAAHSCHKGVGVIFHLAGN